MRNLYFYIWCMNILMVVVVKEQISFATEALHTLFNSSNYEHEDIYNYEEFRLKFQELQKKYEKIQKSVRGFSVASA